MPTPAKGYRNAAGDRVPSVTTITGRFKESGGLIHWAWKLGTEDKDYREERDKAADVGTFIHAMAEAHIQQLPPPTVPTQFTEEQKAQASNGWAAFLAWYTSAVRDILWTEKQLVSEEHGFGGTPDAYGLGADGRPVLFDWKSGSIYSDALVQVGGGYAILCEENGFPVDGGFHIVRFGKDTGDFVHRYFPELDIARQQFLHLRAAYDLDKILKKRAA